MPELVKGMWRQHGSFMDTSGAIRTYGLQESLDASLILLQKSSTHLGCADDLSKPNIHPAITLHHVTIICLSILKLHKLHGHWWHLERRIHVSNLKQYEFNDDERLVGHDSQQRAFPLFEGELKGAWIFRVVRSMLTTNGGTLMGG